MEKKQDMNNTKMLRAVLNMNALVLADQQGLTCFGSVQTRDEVCRICQELWTIATDGERQRKGTPCYLDLMIYVRGAFNKFSDIFVQAFKIVVDTWKFSILLLYILWNDWPIFMISDLNEQLQQQLEYTLLKPDCHSWSISKMQSGRQDNLEERYAIKFCFKLGKNAT